MIGRKFSNQTMIRFYKNANFLESFLEGRSVGKKKLPGQNIDMDTLNHSFLDWLHW